LKPCHNDRKIGKTEEGELMPKELLRMEDIVVTYDKVNVLDHARLNLFEGEVLGVTGVNYSGKTALTTCITGNRIPESGNIYYKEEPVKIKSSSQARKQGVFHIQNISTLVSDQSVIDNFFFSSKKDGVLLPRKKMEQMAREALELLDINIDIYCLAKELSYKERVLTEIAKAIVYEANIIVFDNVLNSLSERALVKIKKVFEMLTSFRMGIILVDTGIKYLKPYCDRLIVMRGGTTAAIVQKSEFDDDYITSLMIGYRLENKEQKIANETEISSENLMEFRNVRAEGILKGLFFAVKKGERLGILNVNKHSGMIIREILEGKLQPSGGHVLMEGEVIKYGALRSIIKSGITVIPEGDLIFEGRSFAENIRVSSYKNMSYRLGVTKQNEVKYRTSELISQFFSNIDGIYSADSPISNSRVVRRKVMLCRALVQNPKVIVMLSPTLNMDMLSKPIIYRDIRSLGDLGIATVVISSDIGELIAVANRIVIIKDGDIEQSIVVDEETTRELIYKYGKHLQNI
jgi:ABC-type sugar transport system ATPase subunit